MKTMKKLIALIESMSPEEQEKMREMNEFVHLWSLMDCLSWNSISLSDDSSDKDDLEKTCTADEVESIKNSESEDEISFYF